MKQNRKRQRQAASKALLPNFAAAELCGERLCDGTAALKEVFHHALTQGKFKSIATPSNQLDKPALTCLIGYLGSRTRTHDWLFLTAPTNQLNRSVDISALTFLID